MYKIHLISMVFLTVNILTCFSSHGELSKPEDIAFKSSLDGSKQYYMEMLPVNFDRNKQYNLIIGLHGHGSNRRQFAFNKRPECASFREFAATHNMIAVTPDYRAKTSWMGPAAEADMIQIIKELKSKYNINKVFLVGGSMGGASALTFAALHPDMVNGVTSMNGLANHIEYKRFQDAIAASFGGTKEQIPEEYKKRSAEFHYKKLTMPVALTAGGKDSSVPPDSVIRLAGLMEQNKQKVFLIKRPQAGHATSFEDAMSAMEFMLTGIPPKKTIETEVKFDISQAAIVKSKAQSGEGGIFFHNSKPAVEANGCYNLGLKFYMEKSGKIKAFCFYQAKNESGSHTFRLWDINGKLLLVVNAAEINKSGWINLPLAEPFAVSASTEYILSYNCNKAYPATPNVFLSPVKRNGTMALAGQYSKDTSGTKYPDKTYKRMNYFVDIIFSNQK